MSFQNRLLSHQDQEHRRVERYQHHLRGLSFQQLWLPPSTDRRVNMIGKNHHVYRGQLPTVPLDQLPPEVDPESIDKEALYRELETMTFPSIPPHEDYGPARRVGGEYTRARRLTFAPIQIRDDSEGGTDLRIPILGVDGKIYRGSLRNQLLPVELDPRLSGTKRPVRHHAIKDTTCVSPSVVSLHVDGKSYADQKPEVPVIQVPLSDLKAMVDAAGSGAKRISFVAKSSKEDVGTFKTMFVVENTSSEQRLADTEESPEEQEGPVVQEEDLNPEGDQDIEVELPTSEDAEDTSVTEDMGVAEEPVVTADEEPVAESQGPSAGELEETNVGGESPVDEPSVVEEDILVGPSQEPVSEENEAAKEETPVEVAQEQNADDEG